MIYVNRFCLELTEFNAVAGLYDTQITCVKHIVFTQLAFDKTYGQRRSVYGHIYHLKQICQSAYVVLMAVRDKYTLYLVRISLHICEIGNDKVNTEHV